MSLCFGVRTNDAYFTNSSCPNRFRVNADYVPRIEVTPSFVFQDMLECQRERTVCKIRRRIRHMTKILKNVSCAKPAFVNKPKK